MHRKALSLGLIFMFLFPVTLGLYAIQVFATSETLHVPSTDYPTIQAAINAANSGDIIQVANGTYNEGIIVDKSVSLFGDNSSNTIIDGSGTGKDVVRILANNVVVKGFTIQNGESYEPTNLAMGGSRGAIISNNIIRQSQYGLKIRESNDSNIVNNIIANNTVGIFFSNSNGNNVTGNLIEKNAIGASTTLTQGFITTKPNKFYHNNFINNVNQVSVIAPTKWDNDAEGNYWSDYSGQDLNGDGIGDTETPYLGMDRYPLFDKWSETRDFFSVWKGVNYHTIVRCNSTVASFNFTYSLAQISFNVTGPQNIISCCNVTIDKSFLDGTFVVLVDRASRSYVSTQNTTRISLYFTLSHSVRKVQIKGTKVVGDVVPTANFTYSPAYPKESQDIQFTDSSADPDGTLTAWSWSFGDGNTSFQQNPVNRYMKKGTCTVMLTVTDDKGATNSVSKIVVVTAFFLDYTLYYILIGTAAGALILVITLFLLKKKKK
jgi:parallel beta-helix repeat protein